RPRFLVGFEQHLPRDLRYWPGAEHPPVILAAPSMPDGLARTSLELPLVPMRLLANDWSWWPIRTLVVVVRGSNVRSPRAPVDAWLQNPRELRPTRSAVE